MSSTPGGLPRLAPPPPPPLSVVPIVRSSGTTGVSVVVRAPTVAAATASAAAARPTSPASQHDQLRRLDLQLAQLRSGLVGLQRKLLDGQSALLARHVDELQHSGSASTEPLPPAKPTEPWLAPMPPPPPPLTPPQPPSLTQTAPAALALASLPALAPTPAAGTLALRALLALPPQPPPASAAPAVHTVLDMHARPPEERLALATSVAALRRVRRRIDGDATDSSSGESGSDDDGRGDAAADDDDGAAHGPRRNPLRSATGLAGGEPARVHQALDRAAVSERVLQRTWRCHDRTQFAWRQQWLRLQLLDLDARIHNTPLARQLSESQGLASALSAPGAQAPVDAAAAVEGTCARAHVWTFRRRKNVARRPKLVPKYTGPTPFFHEFLSFPEERLYVTPKPAAATKTATAAGSSSKQHGGPDSSLSLSSSSSSSTGSRSPSPPPNGSVKRARTMSLGGLLSAALQSPADGLRRASLGLSQRRSITAPSSPVLSSLRRTFSTPSSGASSPSSTPKKRKASGFEIDNLVMPASMVQPIARITPIEVKEILTPSWRVLSSSPERRGKGARSSPPPPVVQDEEPTDDATFAQRHMPKELLERAGQRFDVLAEERRRLLLANLHRHAPAAMLNPPTSVTVSLTGAPPSPALIVTQ